MARRSATQTVERDKPPVPARTRGSVWLALRTGVTWTFVLLLILGGIWSAWKIDSFLLSDPMFTLAGPPEPGTQNPGFRVEGAVHSSEDHVARIFARDFGRSIYRCPLAERRRMLLGMNWVKEASIQRIWPSTLVVTLEERTPVAFVQLTGRDGNDSIWLVDADGVLLDPQRAVKLGLPFIEGIKASQSEQSRRERVRRFLRVQSDLGKLMEQIAETDLSDINNIRVTQVFDGRALTLMLGNQQFLGRYLSFRDNYAEIRKRLPNATVFDVRLKDRITAIESDAPVAVTKEQDK
ncbi:MAG TPA: FtsQ-type POTRA domain-containing protein [Bryobacteraceae bacterium]|nr:FtsQ-type POTRA domain-containing protein [Bryobacteraceae bacterium]